MDHSLPEDENHLEEKGAWHFPSRTSAAPTRSGSTRHLSALIKPHRTTNGSQIQQRVGVDVAVGVGVREAVGVPVGVLLGVGVWVGAAVGTRSAICQIAASWQTGSGTASAMR